tara:strand:+ start:45 stop:266 length:222 start_codon:yes stop_codon:yes gene_type:complete
MLVRFLILSLLFINVLFPCAVCYGDPNDPMTIGLTKSIGFLLAIIGFILFCLMYWFVSLIRRNNQLNSTEGVK